MNKLDWSLMSLIALTARTKVFVTLKPYDKHTLEEVSDDDIEDLIGYEDIICCLVFDIKLCSTRNARFVATGATAEDPASSITQV